MSWYDVAVSDWLLVLLIILGVYRVTRLIIADTFPPIGVPRERLLNWWLPSDDWRVMKGPDGKFIHADAKPHWGAFGASLHYLFTCPWCMSVWVGGLGIWALDAWWHPIPAPALVWAAASAATGLLCGLEDKLS